MRLKRSELTKKYNLTKNAWDKRHDELLDWLNDFFPVKEIQWKNGYYYYEVPDELPESIPKLPRKTNMQQKVSEYEQYVVSHLPKEPTPLSKAKMSRDAMADFGTDKFGHTHEESVSRRYVGPAMDKHGEHSDKMIWVNYKTYDLLTEEEERCLHEYFREEHLTELEMANAFKKYAQKEDISKELNSYNTAVDKFIERYGFRPISVYRWRLKQLRENAGVLSN